MSQGSTQSALRAAAVLLLFASIAGCARAPTFRSVLADKYPGYDQVMPSSEVVLNEPRFDYLPGNVLVLQLVEPRSRREAAVYSNSSIYCPVNIPLASFREHEARPVSVKHDVEFSLRRALGLAKAKADLRLEENEIEVLRLVKIDVSLPRIYSIQRNLRPQFAADCLTQIAGRSDLRRIRAILVGNIRVKVLFKDNVSLFARIYTLSRLQASLGLGYAAGETYDLAADNVVFGAKLRPYVAPTSKTKP